MKKIFIFITVALGLMHMACNDTGTKAKPEGVQKIKIENNGVNIEYDDTKNGDTVLVFIHGWGINKSYWANQTGFFKERYRVVSPDLPGFGSSGKNRQTFTVDDYAKDISAVLNGLDLKNVILVGHSMSGVIALEAALTNPQRVIGIIGIDNFKSVDYVETPESKIESEKIYKQMRTDFTETLTSYANQALFSPSTDKSIKERVLNDMLIGDSVIAVDCMMANDRYPVADKLRSFKKTLFIINSSFVPTDTAAFTKNKFAYQLFDIGPTGHYPMLEKPAEFSVFIQQAIDQMK
jgi:pimeloyl-ACP methyl ester carboxylesterase